MRKPDDEKLFTTLLRSALWGTPVNITAVCDEQYKGVMMIARKQRMEAMIGEVFIRHQVKLGRHQVAHLLSIIKATERQNYKMNRLLTAYTEDLCQHGIRYHVVKGQAVGTYYPSPLMRTPGDIDIFFPEKSYVAAVALAEKQGMKMWKGNERGKHKVLVREGVVFELHWRLLIPAFPWHRREWDSIIDKCWQQETGVIINSRWVGTLPMIYHMMYVFMHLFYHLITSGVGLRQLCDVAVLLKRCDETGVDWQKVIKMVETLGYLKAFRAVLACCFKSLGLAVAVPVVLQDSDYRWGARIYRRMMKGGNFGLEQRWIRSAGWLHRMETAWIMWRNMIQFGWLVLGK